MIDNAWLPRLGPDSAAPVCIEVFARVHGDGVYASWKLQRQASDDAVAPHLLPSPDAIVRSAFATGIGHHRKRRPEDAPV